MRVSCAILLSSCPLLLSGCTGMPVATMSNTDSVPGTVLQGSVHGGQNPIVGAHVYLLAVNTSGYGGPGIAASGANTSASLLTTGAGHDSLGYYVTTDSIGNFTITGDYTRPSAYAHPYFYASGGDPGLGSGANSAIALVAPAQACNSSASTDVNEVSTVVTAYAFAGFASDPTHVSSSNTSLAATGLTNAADTVGNLENVSTSVALAKTPAGNGTVPQTEINTLANILAACVNSTGPASTPCTTLFANALNNAVSPTDTATAALNIAHNPGANVGNLFGLQTPTSPFQPSLPSMPAPNDFTIAITYTGAGMANPGAPAVDAGGNIWVGNITSVSELSPIGSAISGSSGFTGSVSSPYGIAIDSSGDAWVSNWGTNTLTEFNSSGSPVMGSPFSGGGLSEPIGIAIDSGGNVWVANNNGSSISKFNSAGSPAKSSGYTVSDLDQPYALAIDTSNNVWVGSYDSFIPELSSTGSALAGSSAYSTGSLFYSYTAAVDASNNVWVTSYPTSGLTEFEPGTGFLSPQFGYSGGGLHAPNGTAIDGAGNIWISNLSEAAGGDISQFSSSGTPI